MMIRMLNGRACVCVGWSYLICNISIVLRQQCQQLDYVDVVAIKFEMLARSPQAKQPFKRSRHLDAYTTYGQDVHNVLSFHVRNNWWHLCENTWGRRC